MTIINGTTSNNILTVQSDTTSVSASSGVDTVVFSGDYADYTFSQSNSDAPLMTHNATSQVVSLYDVEKLQFDDRVVSLSTAVSGVVTLNTIPSLVSNIADISTNKDSIYRYDASVNFTDIDTNNDLTYSATLADGSPRPAWLSINTTAGVLSGTPANSDIGTIDIIVTATDTSGDSISDTYVLTVNNANNSLTISTAILTDSDGMLMNNISINLWANNVDTGVSLAATSGKISSDNVVDFDIVKLSVADAYDSNINISDAIDVLRHIVNLQTLTVGSVNYHAADVNNDGEVNISDAIDVLRHIVNLEAIDTFDLINDQGNRVTQMDANSTSVPPGWVIVANGDVDQSGGFGTNYVVAPIAKNTPTIFMPITNASTNEDEVYTYNASANFNDTDPGDSLTYSATLADGSLRPTWLSINTTTGVLSGTPTNNDVGVIDIAVTAKDTTNAAVSDTYTLTVNNANDAASISGVVTGTVTEDSNTTTVTGIAIHTDVDTNNDDDIFSAVTVATNSVGGYGTYTVSTAGEWIYTLDNTNTTVNALVNETLNDTFTIAAEDGTTQTITVAITGTNSAPAISVSNLTSINENTALAAAASVSATDDEDGSIVVVLSGNGEDDDKFEIVNGNLRIKLSADYELQNSYKVQLSVTDSGGTTILKNIEVNVTDLAESVSGSVVDGYVASATIFQDLNNNNVLDAQEPYTVTSSTGEFTLSNIVSSSSAPLKIISGFDIGTNKAIVTSLGTPSTSSGQVTVSPLSTVASLASINDTAVGSATSIDRAATYFDVSSTSQSKINLLSEDPLEKLRDDDAEVVSAAKDVFEANQLVMALTHTAETFGSYLSTMVDAAVQTELSSQSITGYDALASGSIDTYKKLAADVFMENTSTHIVPAQTLTSDNAFQISSTQAIWNDYDPASQLDIQNRVTLSTTDSEITINTNETSFNLQNLKNSVNEAGVFKAPTISIELVKVPTGSGSGTISIDLIDGNNSTFTQGDWPNSGERKVHLDIDIDWTADGTTAQIILPAQTVSGYYYVSSGSRIDFTIDNLDSDTLSITKAGFDYPASLDLSFTSLINNFEQIGSISILQANTFHLTMSTDLPLADENGNIVTSISSILKITDGSPLSIFVADVDVHEGDATPTAVVYLNQIHSEDVVVTYSLSSAANDTATATSDYTSVSGGTVTILAGYTSATINLPILEDGIVETNETATLVIDNVTAGSIGTSSASITIHDSTKTITSSGELSSLSADVIDSINSTITTTLENAYNAAAINAGETWILDSTVFTTAANDLIPGLKTIIDVFYGIIKSEIDNAATTQDVSAFASSLMVVNAATKLFDPATIIGTNINGDGSYLVGQSLATLTAAIEAEYATFKSLTNETIGDIFGDDTATYFASATVAMLTDGNDTETLSNASEIIATFDGIDTVYGLGGNDKMIGGKDVDNLYGGDGNDHIYGFSGDDVLDGGAGNDKLVGGLGNDTINAGAGDDLIMAQTGDDIITTGSGSDEVYGGLGNDTINITNKTGTFTDTINGGAGTDTLNINYSGISSLRDFTLFKSGSVTTLTDSTGGAINFESIENLIVNNLNYTTYTGGYYVDGRYAGLTDVIWSPTEKILYSDGSGSVFYAGGMTGGEDSHLEGLENFDDFEFIGDFNQNTINLNVNRSTYTGDFTINTGGGNDSMHSAKLKNTDSINLGAGDDSISVMVSGTYGTPSLSTMDMTLLDGGTGTDTISFEESTVANGTTLSLTTGGATNFESLTGSASIETLNGDANANTITGNGGTDTIYGNAGDDILYGYANDYMDGGASYQSGDDVLYGGSGDDQLYGTAGENTLDGGTGKDTMYGGNGADTFVLRVGDGSSVLANVDVIADFQNGTDVIGMDDGLLFADLSVIQGVGDYSNDTFVSITSTGEYLAIVEGMSATALTEVDFTPVDIL